MRISFPSSPFGEYYILEYLLFITCAVHAYLIINAYRWTRKIFRTGYKKDLEETDLYATLTQDRMSYLGEIIIKAWEKEVESCNKKKNGCKPQLLRVLFRCFGKPFILIGIAFAVMELFSRYIKQMKINESHINMFVYEIKLRLHPLQINFPNDST